VFGLVDRHRARKRGEAKKKLVLVVMAAVLVTAVCSVLAIMWPSDPSVSISPSLSKVSAKEGRQPSPQQPHPPEIVLPLDSELPN
jgi:flagellar basal body-associated protein FliL